MPVRLRRSRPALPRFAVAWFPDFPGIERIEAFRRRHDPAAAFIPAHLSLVFPFGTSLTALQIGTHVHRVAGRWPPIPVTFRRARIHANEFVFLMAARGAAAITALHDKLYTRSLLPHLRRDLAYEPHITLARNPSLDAVEAALAEAEETLAGEHADVIRSLSLLAVARDGKIEILREIPLF